MKKCLNYKNLVLTTEGIMFDTFQFKIFELDEEHIQEFENVYRGITKEKDSFISRLIKDSTTNYDLKTVKINMTNFCNLKCNYCFANEGTYNKKKRKFDKNLIDKFIDFLILYPTVQNITFFGGEPLLNVDGIEYLCQQVNNLRPDIGFYCQTNGTLMNKRIDNLIHRYKIKFTLSIDGSKEDNDRNRVFKDNTGSFDVINENYKRFKENALSIEATYDGKSKYTKKEIAEYLTKKYGCTNVSVCELFGNSRTIEFTSPKKDIEDILNCSSIPINRTRELLLGFFTKTNQCYFCSAGTQLLNIDSDGKIYPCHLLIDKKEKYLLGDLTSFNKDEFESKRLRFSEKVNKKSYEQCKKCNISWNCSQCFAAKEDFNFKDCKKMNENALEIYEELAREIKRGRLNEILNKLKGAVKYV